MAIFLYGFREGGRIEVLDDTWVETRLFYWGFFPFVAQGSILALGPERYSIPTHARSASIGRQRSWLLLLALFAFSYASAQPRPFAFALAGVGVVLLALWVRAMRAGRLSVEETAQRRAYKAITGYSADPALVAHANPTLAEHLRVELTTRAERLAPDGYRDALLEWQAVATKGGEADAQFLALALTLARVERRDDVHTQIWQRLAPLASALPATIAPVTTHETPGANLAPFTPGVTLATARGTFREAGFDVVIPHAAYGPPPMCSSCLAPAQLTRSSSKGGRAVPVPYCSSCALHGSKQASGNAIAKLVVVLSALGTGALGLAFATLPLALAAVAAAAVAVAFGVAWLLPVRRAAAPATMTLDAARLVARRGESMTLFCTNDEWSQRLAAHFGGTRTASARVHPRSLQVPAVAVALALGGGFFAWHGNNPRIRVDNGTGAPVAIWVDGRVVDTVPPTNGPADVSVRVARGVHSVGWSAVGAAAPIEHVSRSFAFLGGDYLLDPSSHHCYLVDATAYGSASTNEHLTGPRPVGLLHDFGHVRDWFEKSPASDSKGTVRYALRRADACEPLRACPAGTRETYWNCLVGATEAGVERCNEAAQKACGWDAED